MLWLSKVPMDFDSSGDCGRDLLLRISYAEPVNKF
jgi:hypothetical protein